MNRRVETDLALAAITAAEALLANMIAARILGTASADLRRCFSANTTDEWHGPATFWSHLYGLRRSQAAAALP